MPKNNNRLWLENSRFAHTKWGSDLSSSSLKRLGQLTKDFHFSLSAGDLILLQNGWYVTHSGLIALARRRHCNGIEVRPVTNFCDPTVRRWAFKAIVFKSGACKGFTGYGDADPNNVSEIVHGAEMRVAETRAVNRALRKAYGIGLCSVEEIGSTSLLVDRGSPEPPKHAPKSSHNGNGTSSTLRDRLTLLIRRHQLDPALVKLYAADFCAVRELRNASRESIERFVNELASRADTDRVSLLCKLNSYAPKREGAA